MRNFYLKIRPVILTLSFVAIATSLNACAVFAVVDTAVSVAATGIKTTAKVIGGATELVVDAVTPSKDEEKPE